MVRATGPARLRESLGRMSKWMTTPKVRVAALVLGAVTVTVLRLSLYDEVQKSPKLFHPPLLLFESFMLFVLINIVFFGVNVIKSLASVGGSHDEQHVQEALEPALQGHITNDALQRWRQLPYFFSLGIVAASALMLMMWLLRK